MKKYVVMTDYHTAGWVITGESDDFDEAVKLRDDSMGNGNRNVVIFSPVKFVVSEVTDQS
mgnify:CR=1 FL=1